MTPAEWKQALAPSRAPKDCYSVVVAAVTRYLDSDQRLGLGGSITTTQLVNQLYPPRYVTAGDDIGEAAIRRLYKLVLYLADKQLSEYASKSKATVIWMGKPAHRWEWHARQPKPPTDACATCGRPFN